MTLGGLSAEAIAVFGRLEPFPQHWGLPDKESNQKEADASRKLQPRPRHPVRWQKPPRASNPKILSSRLRTPGRMTWGAGSCGRSLQTPLQGRSSLSKEPHGFALMAASMSPGFPCNGPLYSQTAQSFLTWSLYRPKRSTSQMEKIPLPGPASSTSWKQCPTGSHLEQNSCLSTAIGVDLAVSGLDLLESSGMRVKQTGCWNHQPCINPI